MSAPGAPGSGELLVGRSGAVATVTLNRPEARNALSGTLVAALDEAIGALDADDSVAAIVLTGTDPAFCAGFDLKNLANELAAVRDQRLGRPPRHLGLLPDHDTPIIGAVNGAAVTGGLELALACDFLLASERARFADTHARVGVMPGGGMTIRLPALIGVDRARRMSLTGDFIDAQRAYEWGLVTEVVPHTALLARAVGLGEAIASIPRPAIVEVRRMYAEMATLAGPEAFERESRWSRTWMVERFDQERLAAEREAIVERGRSQQ